LVRSWYVVRSCPPFFFLFGSTDVEKLFWKSFQEIKECYFWQKCFL
jgi:hypothetical protein